MDYGLKDEKILPSSWIIFATDKAERSPEGDFSFFGRFLDVFWAPSPGRARSKALVISFPGICAAFLYLN